MADRGGLVAWFRGIGVGVVVGIGFFHEWPVARVLRGEESCEEEIYFLREDGRWVLARIQAVPILKDGKVAGAVATALKVREFAEPPWAPGSRGTE